MWKKIRQLLVGARVDGAVNREVLGLGLHRGGELQVVRTWLAWLYLRTGVEPSATRLKPRNICRNQTSQNLDFESFNFSPNYYKPSRNITPLISYPGMQSDIACSA
jgi:hypothetical protein